MTKVLVLDGRQRSALAATRSLGSRGLVVVTADTSAPTLAGASRYAGQQLTYPDPRSHPGTFVDWVVSACGHHGIDFVLPLTDLSTMLLAPEAARLAPATLLAAPAEPYELVSDKGRLVKLAAESGVRVPATIEIHSLDQFEARFGECAFPLVLKPSRSKLRHGDRIHETAVFIAATADDAREYLRAQPWLSIAPCLLQEFIPGHGAGIFAFYAQDRPLAWFCHRRLREKPPQGGVSVLSESVAIDSRLRENAAKILTAARWNGAAMVEFRVTPDGTPYLMEINGRLWGSLQLAIDCGVDFPWLLYQAAAGLPREPDPQYLKGRRLRWLMGDVDNLLIQLRDRRLSVAARLNAVLAFAVTFFSLTTRQEIFRWSDPGPSRHEARTWLRALS